MASCITKTRTNDDTLLVTTCAYCVLTRTTCDKLQRISLWCEFYFTTLIINLIL